jgi:hypothetical protein
MNLDNPSAPIDMMDFPSLKQAHAMVIEEETTATALHQVVAYQRGSVYIRARNFACHDLPLKIFYFLESIRKGQ